MVVLADNRCTEYRAGLLACRQGVEGDLPWKLVGPALPRRARYVLALAEQHVHACLAQGFDVPLECGVAGLCGVEAGESDDRLSQSDGLGDQPRARVSAVPAAHLFNVLKVAGATRMASGAGSSSGCEGSSKE